MNWLQWLLVWWVAGSLTVGGVWIAATAVVEVALRWRRARRWRRDEALFHAWCDTHEVPS